MSFRIVLLIAVILASSNVKGYESCEYENLHKCDEGFVAGFQAHPNDPDMGIYCNVFQHFGDCSSSTSQCKGKFIDSQRYIILQHMTMDKTSGLCPRHDLEALKEVVRADDKYRLHIEHLSGVGNDDFEPCAARIHRKCATQIQEEMESGEEMCTSLNDFIKCYENLEESCSAKIYKDWIGLLRKFASQVLKMYKESPGVMPGDC
ncbi:uncharacterized protein LOC144660735 isoform X2 [Oculina patagonica]